MSDSTAQVASSAGGSLAAYDEAYFANCCGEIPYERNAHWLTFFGKVADGLIRDFHPTTVLDAGCAMGFLVEALRDRGVAAVGIDVSEYAISQVHDSAANHCSVASLAEPIGGRYDLVTCIEVLEHLSPGDTDTAIANLCAISDTVVMSSTPEDFAEPSHLSVLPPDGWAAKFAEQGFMRDLDRDLSYITPWAAVFTRSEGGQVETVRRYDRAWYRLRQEVTEVRRSLLESQQRFAELERQGGVGSRSELATRLEQSEAEVLRLRDLLIGKEAELGVAAGKVAELEQRWNQVRQATAAIPGLNRLKRLTRRR